METSLIESAAADKFTCSRVLEGCPIRAPGPAKKKSLDLAVRLHGYSLLAAEQGTNAVAMKNKIKTLRYTKYKLLT